MPTSQLRLRKVRPAVQAPLAVFGAGDVGAAVAHALCRRGEAVLLIESAQPTSPRRGMCWVDAVFDGSAELAGVRAQRVACPQEAAALLAQRRAVALAVDPDVAFWLQALGVDIVVDARLRKHAGTQPDLRQLGAGAVGIGPGYCAGYNADVVVESAWGDDLGRVIALGPTRDLAGEPRPILGAGRERLVYAPAAGVFTSARRIGDAVQAGDAVAAIVPADAQPIPVHAPLTGVLRGLTRPGVTVPLRAKVVEVDPRGDPALCFGLGERPQRIAQGVLDAVDLLRARLAPPPSVHAAHGGALPPHALDIRGMA